MEKFNIEEKERISKICDNISRTLGEMSRILGDMSQTIGDEIKISSKILETLDSIRSITCDNKKNH